MADSPHKLRCWGGGWSIFRHLPSLSVSQQVIFVYVVSLICTFTCGSQYSISAWTPHLKAELNCTQGEIEVVGELGNIGAYLGPLTGTVVFVLPELWVSLVCAACTLFGFLPMAIAILHGPAASGGWASMRSTTTLGGFFLVTGFASATLYNLVLTVNIANIAPHRRGLAVAVISTLYGLSASLYTVIYNHALGGNVGHFLLFLCFLLASACLLAAVSLRKIDRGAVAPKMGDDDDISTHHVRLPDEEQSIVDARQQVQQSDLEELPLDSRSPSGSPPAARAHMSHATLTLLNKTAVDSAAAEAEEDERRWRQLQQDEAEQVALQARCCGGGIPGYVFGSAYALGRRPAFWLLLFIFFLIVGAGLMLINNLGHIVQSLNDGVADPDYTTVLILVLSLANGSGRLVMGLSDFVRWRKGVWLTAVCCLMTFSHLLLAFALQDKSQLVVGVIGVGLAYGAIWALMPIIASDNFGRSTFSMNFGWIGSISGFASLFFNDMAGRFYDSETPEGSTQCVGTSCFQNAFVLCLAGAAIAIGLSVALIPRTVRGKNKHASKGVAAH